MNAGKIHRGFTLVEILIVVILLGILSSIAVGMFGDSATETRCVAYATTVKQFHRMLNVVRVKNGGAYPPDQYPGETPLGAEPYIHASDWAAPTPLGGKWDWEYGVFGITAGISVVNPDADDEIMTTVDSILDNGNLSSGHFRKISGRYIYVLQE